MNVFPRTREEIDSRMRLARNAIALAAVWWALTAALRRVAEP